MSDCMTQEDAERMDANQAVQLLKPLRDMMLDQYGCPISDAYFALSKAIEALEQLTVDAVPEVVRCKECKYIRESVDGLFKSGYFCERCHITSDMDNVDDWFCADGKRKDGAE